VSTIQEVAERAGVAKSTASLAFSSPERVSEATRKRIRDAAEALGYRPNALAQSLRAGRSRLIGLVMADTRNPFNGEILQQVQEAALEHGHMVVASTTNEDAGRERKVLDELAALRVAGILLAPHSSDPDFLAYLRRLKPRIALIDQALDGFEADVVTSDSHLGASMLTAHLLGLGHQRIAHIAGSPGLWTSEQRCLGFESALRAAGVPPAPDLLLHGDFRGQSGYEQAMRLLTRPDRPTAIVAANNFMALGALKAMEDLSIRCPDDVSLASFDDVPWGEVVKPRLTCVVQPVPEIARLSVRWLLERIGGGADALGPPRSHRFIPTLIRGASTSPPAGTAR
jgi:LacI family transcriptional regulator